MGSRQEMFAVFAGKILLDLYTEFPLPATLDRGQAALIAVFDFETLDRSRRELYSKQAYRDLIEDLVKSDNPHLSESQRVKFTNLLEEGSHQTTEVELEKKIQGLEQKRQEIAKVWDGTVSFLAAEGYIRSVDDQWQLSEKGFGHLRKRFSDRGIEEKDTFAERIREQFANPTNMGAQVLLQILGGLAGRIF